MSPSIKEIFRRFPLRVKNCQQALKVLSVSMILILSACKQEKEHSDLKELVGNLKKQPVKSQDLTSGFSFHQEHIQQEYQGPSPFPEKKLEKEGKDERPTSPLESYSLTTFRLLGIIQEGDIYQAIFILPDGKTTQISLGSLMGEEKAVVEKITSNQVIVVYPDNIKKRVGHAQKIFQLEDN